jgi:hypothetical protein
MLLSTLRSLKNGFVDRKYCSYCVNFRFIKEDSSITLSWHFAEARQKLTQNRQNARKTIGSRAILALPQHLISNCRMRAPVLLFLHMAGRNGARSALRGIIILDFLDTPNLSIDQPYLDPMWVGSGVGQNILDDSSGQFSCSLVLLEND